MQSDNLSRLYTLSYHVHANVKWEFKRNGFRSSLQTHPGGFEKYQEHKTRPKETSAHGTQMTLQQTIGRSTSVHQCRVNDAITKFVVNGLQPLRIVETDYFKDFVLALCPNASVLCRKTLGDKIEKQYKVMISNIKREMSSASSICTTADIWSTNHKSFMGMTAHWLTENLQRESCAIACRRVTGRHTFDKIGEMISEIHGEFVGYDQCSKIVYTVTDNASNFVKSFKMFGVVEVPEEFQRVPPVQAQVGEPDLSSGSDDGGDGDEVSFSDICEIMNQPNEPLVSLPSHMRCAAHTLNLIATTDVTNALSKQGGSYKKLYRGAMAKCSKLWSTFNHSDLAANVVQDLTGMSLRTPGETRWNSTFDAVRRLTDERVKDHLPEIMEKLKLPPFSRNEVECLEEYVIVFSPLAEALDRLQGEKHCFLGELMPTVQQTVKSIRVAQRTLKHSSELAEALLAGLQKRFGDMINFAEGSKVFAVAAVCHPTFKLRWVPKEKKEWARNCFTEAVVKNASLCVGEASSPRQTSGKQDSFFDFEEDCAGPEVEHDESVRMECLRYLEQPAGNIEQLELCPRVKGVFIQLNCVLPSSAPVERLFSTGALVETPRRNRLSDSMFQKLLLLKANEKFCK